MVNCELGDAALGLRIDRWKRLLSVARSISRVCDGAVVTFKSDEVLLSEVRRLVKLERQCCAWMRLRVDAGAETTRLTVTARTQKDIHAIQELFMRA